MARNMVVRTNDPFFMPLSAAVNALFNDAQVGPRSAEWATAWGLGSRLPLNIYADSEGYTFVALVPGVKADELNIETEGNTVKISGELVAPAVSADEKVQALRSEIGFGKFSRAFEMPEEIDADKIDANLESGVLTVRVPKAEAVKPRTIKVQAK
jgi:HSP20 family protein